MAGEEIIVEQPIMSEQELQQFGLQLRAQNIQDMLGARPLDINTFQKQQGSLKYGKALLIGLGLGALVGIPSFFFKLEGALTILCSGMAAALGVVASFYEDTNKLHKTYANYLSSFATKARIEHEKQLAAAKSPAVQQEQNTTKDKQWAADVANSRTTAPAAGVTPL